MNTNAITQSILSKIRSTGRRRSVAPPTTWFKRDIELLRVTSVDVVGEEFDELPCDSPRQSEAPHTVIPVAGRQAPFAPILIEAGSTRQRKSSVERMIVWASGK
jgi:hypothetical protein